MFNRILQWIKEVWNRMIGQSSIKQSLNVDIAVSPLMVDALQTWSLLYENKASWLNNDVKSLNLAAAVSSEIARAATIEMKIEFSGGTRAVFLQKQFDKLLPMIRPQLEYACAKGGMVLKPYISGKNINVDFVQADALYPVSFDSSGNITAAIFADQRTIGDKFYTRLEFHQMTGRGCAIRNLAFKSSTKDTLGTEVALTEVPEWAEIQPEALITGIDKPLFAYFRYPLANNIDPLSPLGVSCYSRAIDLIHQADVQWSDLLWEFESGRRAL